MFVRLLLIFFSFYSDNALAQLMDIDPKTGQIIYQDGTALPDYVVQNALKNVKGNFQTLTFDEASKSYSITVNNTKQKLNPQQLESILEEATTQLIEQTLSKQGLTTDPRTGNIVHKDGRPVTDNDIAGLQDAIQEDFVDNVVKPAIDQHQKTQQEADEKTAKESKDFDDQKKQMEDSSYNGVQTPRSAGMTALELGALGGVAALGLFVGHKVYKNHTAEHNKNVREVEKLRDHLKRNLETTKALHEGGKAPFFLEMKRKFIPEALHERFGVADLGKHNIEAHEKTLKALNDHVFNLERMQAEAKALEKSTSATTKVKSLLGKAPEVSKEQAKAHADKLETIKNEMGKYRETHKIANEHIKDVPLHELKVKAPVTLKRKAPIELAKKAKTTKGPAEHASRFRRAPRVERVQKVKALRE